MEKEIENFVENDKRERFDRIFDFIPSKSWYLAMVILFAFYLEVPAGTIQLGGVIMQADAGKIDFCSCDHIFNTDILTQKILC